MSSIDAGTILEVTRTLIGETEPSGDSAVDNRRARNLEKLIYVVDELLRDVEKAAVHKNRLEGSMKDMGEKADKALSDWHDYIEEYYEEEF